MDAPEDRLYHDPGLARFYDFDNHWGADDAFCHALAAGRARVLDLGCGTGRLACRIAQDHEAAVTGVDPAAAMLALAAAKPGGAQVRWVCADARGLDLGGQFDLVVMTGHAFQCFLTDEDRVALLATIARHLAPEGLFLFDSRNPSCAEWQGWTPEATREIRPHPTLGPLESWNDVVWDASRAVATYQTFYRPVTGDQCFQAHSAIGFTNQSRLASLIDAAGLRVDRWLGGWDGAPFTPEAAEIIPLGGLAL